MKIAGYGNNDITLNGLIELESIAIAASPKIIKDLAVFLNYAADEMEKMGSDYDPIHLMDEW
jgi:hypothetical protein